MDERSRTINLGNKVGAGGCGLAKAGLRKVRAPEKPNLLGNAQCERS